MPLCNPDVIVQPKELKLTQKSGEVLYCDLLVVGAGLAGLTVALEVAQTRKIIVLAKRELTESATAWAQGGIVGVLDEKDSFESHVVIQILPYRFVINQTVCCVCASDDTLASSSGSKSKLLSSSQIISCGKSNLLLHY